MAHFIIKFTHFQGSSFTKGPQDVHMSFFIFRKFAKIRLFLFFLLKSTQLGLMIKVCNLSTQ